MKEFEWIHQFVKPVQDSSVFMGPGDDCSLINFDSENYLASSTDSLVESIHFRLSDISIEELAYKALAVNISDLAAMGARPRWSHLSLSVPQTFTTENVELFFRFFYDLASKYQIELVGGDVTGSKTDLFINIHLSGLVPKKNVQLCTDFIKSTLLCVTGSLGGSAAGLKALLNNGGEEDWEQKLINQHFKPPILVEEGVWLSQQQAVAGMMDLSDGLLCDLRRLKKTDIEVHLEEIPHSQELLKFCALKSKDPFLFSLAGGEDYQLLFGCKESQLAQLKEAYYDQFAKNFFVIGKIKPGSGEIRYLQDGIKKEICYQSFDHFNDAND